MKVLRAEIKVGAKRSVRGLIFSRNYRLGELTFLLLCEFYVEKRVCSFCGIEK